jgi:hypothetical protein
MALGSCSALVPLASLHFGNRTRSESFYIIYGQVSERLNCASQFGSIKSYV